MWSVEGEYYRLKNIIWDLVAWIDEHRSKDDPLGEILYKYTNMNAEDIREFVDE